MSSDFDSVVMALVEVEVNVDVEVEVAVVSDEVDLDGDSVESVIDDAALVVLVEGGKVDVVVGWTVVVVVVVVGDIVSLLPSSNEAQSTMSWYRSECAQSEAKVLSALMESTIS